MERHRWLGNLNTKRPEWMFREVEFRESGGMITKECDSVLRRLSMWMVGNDEIEDFSHLWSEPLV